MAEIRNIFDLGIQTKDVETTATFLKDKGLIFEGIKCEDCQVWMTEVKDSSRVADGYGWRCSRCRTKKSIRTGSFFETSKVALATLLRIMYLFCLDVPVKTTCELMHGDISKPTIIDWFNFCRDICTGYLFRHPVRLGGAGRNDIVEVDEALYKRKNKYHRGHDRGGGKWVFGAIERITNKVIFNFFLFISIMGGDPPTPPPPNITVL